MAKLKLGPLPKLGTVRVTVAVSEPLKEELDLYAAEFSRLHGPADTMTLIPHMLDSFLRSDRGWRSRKAGAREKAVGSPKDADSSTARTSRPTDDH